MTTFPPNAQTPQLVVLSGHTAPVEAVAFSPDGQRIASTGRDGRIILWDVETSTIHRQWADSCGAKSIAFSPDGETLITAEDGVSYWNADTGRWEGTFPNGGKVAALSADGEQLISVGAEEIQWLDSRSGQLLRRVPHGLERLEIAVISEDRRTAVLGAWHQGRHLVRAWDLQSGDLTMQRRLPRRLWWKTRDQNTGRLRTRWGAQADLECLALSPCGRRLAIGGRFTLWICDTQTGRRTHLLICGMEGCHSVVFSPDGKYLGAGLFSGKLVLWRLPSGEQVWCNSSAHRNWVSAVTFSPDGRLLASASHDKSVGLWEVSTGEPYRKLSALQFEAVALAYSPNGERMAVAYTDECLRIWNARTGALERQMAGVPKDVRSVAFSRNGRMLSLSSKKVEADWDAESGKLLHMEAKDGDVGRTCAPPRTEALSPNGRMAAVSQDWKGQIELRTPDLQQILKALPEIDEEDFVVALRFSPDGAMLAAGYSGSRVRLWDVETGELVQLMRSHANSNSHLAFSPDGSLLAVGGDYDRHVVLCNLRTETQPVRMVMIANEWQYLITHLDEFNVSPEEIPGEEVTLAGHTDHIRGIAFAPDGRIVATVAADAALKLWDPATGQLRATLTPLPSHGEGPTEEWIAYTPEGYYVASPGADPCIRWQAGPELLPAKAHAGVYCDPEQVAARLNAQQS